MIITGAQMDVTRKKKHNRRFHIHKAHSIFQMRRKTLSLPKSTKTTTNKIRKNNNHNKNTNNNNYNNNSDNNNSSNNNNNKTNNDNKNNKNKY